MKEYLLNNMLDDEFQRMLFPLNLLQSVLLQSKFRIYHRFVTPNGLSAHLKNFLGVIIIFSVNVMHAYTYHAYLRPYNFVVLFPVFDIGIYGLFSLVTFVVNFAQSQNNVQLVLKIQHAYRLLDNKDGLRRFTKCNWMIIILIVLTCMSLLVCYCYRDCSEYSKIIFILSLLYFDGNIIYATQIIKLLEHEVKLWLVELDRFFVTCSEPNHNELMKYFNEIDQQEKRLSKAFVDIMEAFKLFKGVFQYSILLLAIEAFVHPLIYIQNFLYMFTSNKNDDVTVFFLIVPLMWVAKNFAMLIYLCVACQQLYLALTEVDKTCAVVRGQHELLYMLDIQKLCKNVSRLNACVRTDGGLRACGIVLLDAALPLRLLALLATYTVVLLQFALL